MEHATIQGYNIVRVMDTLLVTSALKAGSSVGWAVSYFL